MKILILFLLCMNAHAMDIKYGETVCITYADSNTGACYYDISKEMADNLRKQQKDMHQAKVKEYDDNGKTALAKAQAAQEKTIKNAADSSLEMLKEATKKYKSGQITKDQFLEISLQAGTMANYNSETACLNLGLTSSGGCH